MFSKYKTIKGLHILNDVCWVFDQKAWFSKDLFQNWYLSDFISTTRLWINMIFEIWDLIPEQKRLSNKNINRICKILDKNDINTSRHSLKSWPPGGNPVDPEKKNKQYSDQLGAKKESNDELAKSIKVIPSNHKSHLVIDRRTSMFRSWLGAMLFKDNPSSNWWAALHSKNIFILVYHLQHGYDFWTMLSHSCIWMNARRMHPPRLTVGPSVLKLKCALHRMNMADEHHWWCQCISSRYDLTSWEESMVKNFELITMSLLWQVMRGMSGRLGSFQEGWW
jgi:hypothetical protein